MHPLVILKAGEPQEAIRSHHGGFEDWTLAAMGAPRNSVAVIDIVHGETLPDPGRIAGAIVTGSPAMVTDHHAWAERSARWLRRTVLAGLPVLGICFGHQLLAHAFGGRVGNNPRGREIGTVRVHLLPPAETDPLLGGFPRDLTVQVTHVQSVLELPSDAIRLAENGHDPNHAFRIGPRAWGVQFHPEFTAKLMRALIDAQRDLLGPEGWDPDALLAAVSPSSTGRVILQRFARISLLATDSASEPVQTGRR